MVKLLKKVLLLSIIILIFLPSKLSAFAYPDLSPYDIIIDVGHGGIDGGTSAKGILEKDLNLDFGIKLYNELKDKSYHVGITRIHDYSLSDDSRLPGLSRHLKDLKQRKLIADALNPKIFISLHVNWSKNKYLRGPVIIYQVSGESYHLANIIQDHLNNYYGIKKYPRKGNPYFLMKNMDMPSIIAELGYLSNNEDFQMLTSDASQNEIVAAMVRAIEEYFLLYPYDNETRTVGPKHY
ncbi:hypothetical protein BKP45_20540 [Anaerobacillus alkalidiazotrophicus]|uniref:MurNAc-LAA domain-containing protein n=1 Tax=Anaerobacillus alkalidiazotrophicus TaxID=472963 RepID=A0A1S2LZX6_9BACI|nr:N-acetylmuramoyl-L-alanine amidase [Anaerobacillus alkalidiazotrophicus]OIJ17946.1 hypothetical protein BKP45_20540 [Anaerobacillus alkalidiazotrophicus]